MAKKKPITQAIDSWHCGVLQGCKDGEEYKAIPKFIYKIENRMCHWATMDELYKYNLKPLTKTLKEWDDTAEGLIWNMYPIFFCPQLSIPKNPEPLPLDADGTIPENKEE